VAVFLRSTHGQSGFSNMPGRMVSDHKSNTVRTSTHPSKVAALTGFAEIATPNLPQINQSGYSNYGTALSPTARSRFETLAKLEPTTRCTSIKSRPRTAVMTTAPMAPTSMIARTRSAKTEGQGSNCSPVSFYFVTMA
jgi:hypothetical protein